MTGVFALNDVKNSRIAVLLLRVILGGPKSLAGNPTLPKWSAWDLNPTCTPLQETGASDIYAILSVMGRRLDRSDT